MEKPGNKLGQAEPLRGLYALTLAAEFLEWTAFNTSESFSYLPSDSSFSSRCNTSDCETSSPAEILSKGAYKKHTSDSCAEESSNLGSELSCLTSIGKKTKFGWKTVTRLTHLATVACCNRSVQCEFNTLNSPSLKTAKKTRSARSFTHSLRNKISSVGWIAMQTPKTVNSAFNSEDGSPGDGTIDTASTGFASSASSFRTNAQDNWVSRQITTPCPEKRENNSHTAVPKKSLGATRLGLRCIAIQKFILDQTSCSEARVREQFGNTPDTSKALRILLKEHRLKRFGVGGRSDPFVYMAVVTLGLSELEKLREAEETGTI